MSMLNQRHLPNYWTRIFGKCKKIFCSEKKNPKLLQELVEIWFSSCLESPCRNIRAGSLSAVLRVDLQNENRANDCSRVITRDLLWQEAKEKKKRKEKREDREREIEKDWLNKNWEATTCPAQTKKARDEMGGCCKAHDTTPGRHRWCEATEEVKIYQALLLKRILKTQRRESFCTETSSLNLQVQLFMLQLLRISPSEALYYGTDAINS